MLRGCERPGCLRDERSGEARDGGRPRRRDGADVVGEAVEAESVFFHEFVIVEILACDDVDHREGQRALTAG